MLSLMERENCSSMEGRSSRELSKMAKSLVEEQLINLTKTLTFKTAIIRMESYSQVIWKSRRKMAENIEAL